MRSLSLAQTSSIAAAPSTLIRVHPSPTTAILTVALFVGSWPVFLRLIFFASILGANNDCTTVTEHFVLGRPAE